MKIEVLECRPDGTQELVQREVPDNWFDSGSGERIAELRAVLDATDYQVIKCSEYQQMGLPAPYDVAALHARRQAARDEINALEEVSGHGEN